MEARLQAPSVRGEGERRPPPFTAVIFGVTGDLTRRKLVPALYHLEREGLLPDRFGVVGVARQELGDEGVRALVEEAAGRAGGTAAERTRLAAFARRFRYLRGDFDDPDTYRRLAAALGGEEDAGGARARLFYLATPPRFYPRILRGLGEADLSREESGAFSRVVVEKPFGRDLATARELNSVAEGVFRESQVFRIDHYLGKETVQNILVFRFANGIFEPVWNRQYIDHVQITVAESLGVEGRASYYDETGALRDMVQNHMLQLVTLIAMEPAVAFDADAVRDEKVKVLRAIRPMTPEAVRRNVVRAQYGPGRVGGEPVPGYRQEPGVSPTSTAETFVALRLFIDNWRWAGVPFYLRTGKRLARRATEIAVQFRRAPHLMFSRTATPELEPNVITMRIQPDEGIVLRLGAKVPGAQVKIRSVDMDFLYETAFASESPEAYERLLLDALVGDSTLFTRRDEVEEAWALVTSILEAWAGEAPARLTEYEAGGWGPPQADALMERDGRRWRQP
ncbi:MAG: glucose-6-phosphate dehydrogenase [Firmicutes bacterium]|nr:glucose-6-phosphate dehydrogenase [Bacillota bacterium]